MKIEMKLSFNSIKKNLKRTIFTIISIGLCTFLILTTLLTISSIRNGITENINIEYNDYHFIIKNLNLSSFNKIKDKPYIDKIYIQENDNSPLKKFDEIDNIFHDDNTINVYIKYNNIKETYKNSTDIVQTLEFSLMDAQTKCDFNEKLLTVYGYMGATLDYADSSQTTLIYKNTLNFSYVIDMMITLILIVFSILFIIILYNAFLITINERKKEYAILNSIGGTEGQILKMVFIEATLMAIIGISIGTFISFLGTQAILNILNNILASATYKFSLVIDFSYIIVAFAIILFNIYISAIIPSIKASNTSVIQNIRNNKQIKYKKNNTLFQKIIPIEGRLALINLKRNKNKYRIITILLVICMTSYIAVSTYINYEEETANWATNYDADAGLIFDSTNIDYQSILNNYIIQSGDKIEYFDYKMLGLYSLVEPANALVTDNTVATYQDNNKSIQIVLIGLEDKEYTDYINMVNANYGDYILYNTVMTYEGEENIIYKYDSAFNTNDVKFSIINNIYNSDKMDYEIIDNENLKGNFVLTDTLLKGFKELNEYSVPIIFINMDTYNKISKKLDDYISSHSNHNIFWIVAMDTPIYVKVNCQNMIAFSNYIENIREKQNMNIIANYYSLDNQEKIIFLNILKLILRIIILTIMIIGIISAINIINASLCEREQEFKILSHLGATKENINKILIYECVYMFIKATIISLLLCIPILYVIIRHMENVIILNKLLIPFGNICIFFALLFSISLFITIYSTRFIKNKL